MCYEHVSATLFIYFFEIFVALLFSPVFVCFIGVCFGFVLCLVTYLVSNERERIWVSGKMGILWARGNHG